MRLPPRDAARLEQFRTELQRWGRNMNLVGSTELAALDVHIGDSLAAVAELRAGLRVVDLGSGAGFPGIPIAIARPDLEVTLVDIRERRVHFLRHVVRTLELSTQVRCVLFHKEAPAAFDVVCLRAVGPPASVVGSAAGWARADGEVWLWTKEPPEDLPFPVHSAIERADRGRIVRARAAELKRVL